MARKSGILIRQLFGNWSNPCAGLPHHRRKLLPNSIQTLTLTLNTTPSSSLYTMDYFRCKLPLSSPNLHFMGHSDCGLKFSSPPNMFIISNVDDHNRAIEEVKDGLLPAVFYFISHRCTPVVTEASKKLHVLRERFPHVTIYKIIKTPVVDSENILLDMNTDFSPAFHCFQNGELVAEIRQDQLEEAFEELYRYIVPVEPTQLSSSSRMGERRAEQLVQRAKKDGNDKGVVRGWKVGSVRALSQRTGAAILSEQRGGFVEAVDTSTAPSLPEVMAAVESLPGGRPGSCLWSYARGLFKYQPKKRVMFSNVQGPYFKVAWLLHEMAEE